ncbi:prepilin peptidase, partial [Candidatus Micrarchaeota archaeon]|nr:prepilin peptidase [Candidatus Micrarchaeota archaeon]
MIERILFEQVTMPGEEYRIAAAIVGTAVTAYYDIFNNKTIPNKILYAFFTFSLLLNLVLFDTDVVFVGIMTAVVIGLFGFFLYRNGQIGGADVIVLASIALLLPIQPSFSKMPFNLPFVFPVLVFAGVIFSLYITFDVGRKILGA